MDRGRAPQPLAAGSGRAGRRSHHGAPAWNGDTLVFVSEGCDVKRRYPCRFGGRDRLHFRLESSPDDGAIWQLLLAWDNRRAQP